MIDKKGKIKFDDLAKEFADPEKFKDDIYTAAQLLIKINLLYGEIGLECVKQFVNQML